MKNIYILQTSFNDVYENDLVNNGLNSIEQFGNNESVAFLNYDKKININWLLRRSNSIKDLR